MNLLFSFIQDITPSRGGTERAAYLVSSYLASRGHTVYFLSTQEMPENKPWNGHYFCPPTNTLQEKIAYVEKLCAELKIDVIVNEAGNTDDVFLFSHKTITEERNIITCIHFDITAGIRNFYRSFNFHTSGISPTDKIKKVLQMLRLPYLKKLNEHATRERYKHAYRYSDKVVLLAPKCVEDFCAFTKYGEKGKVLCIPNPVTYERSQPDLSCKENVLLYVGRVSYSPKKINRILKFWKELCTSHHNWKLQIVGDGDDLPRCKKLAARWNLPRVEFVGAVNDVKPHYEKARILLLASDYEGTPMVVTEAQNHGVIPVVYHTYAGASLHIQHGENGYLIPPFDRKLFVSTLDKLMRKPLLQREEYKEMVRRNERFSLTNIGMQWEKLLNEVNNK